MNDTPETEKSLQWSDNMGWVVHVDLSRKLERERNALRKTAEDNGKAAHSAQCQVVELGKSLNIANPTGIESEVCADIAARQELGIVKYGTTVATNPLHLHEWMQHAYEEALDCAIYLKRAMKEIEKP